MYVFKGCSSIPHVFQCHLLIQLVCKVRGTRDTAFWLGLCKHRNRQDKEREVYPVQCSFQMQMDVKGKGNLFCIALFTELNIAPFDHAVS